MWRECSLLTLQQKVIWEEHIEQQGVKPNQLQKVAFEGLVGKEVLE